MRLLFVSYSLLPPIALSFPIIFSTLAHSVATLVSMKHVACGAAPSAALFSAVLYDSSIANYKAASEYWNGCNSLEQVEVLAVTVPEQLGIRRRRFQENVSRKL